MVLIGPSMVGKSSLVESLIAGEPKLAKVDDRTKVVDIKKWEVTESDTFYIYDQGGHDLYQVTNPYFISPRSTVIICHKVNCPKEQAGVECIQCTKLNVKTSIFESSTQSQLQFRSNDDQIITPNVTAKSSQVEQTLHFLRMTLHQHPENEILIAITQIDLLKHLENFQESQYFSEVEQSIKKSLQLEINNLDKILKKSDGSYSINVETMRNSFAKRLNEIKFFPLSSKSYAGMQDIKEELYNKIKKERTLIPKLWIDTYKDMKRGTVHECSYSYVHDCFRSQNREIHRSFSACNTFLGYFNETGLILWNKHHPELKGYIFHDMDFLVSIFRSLFDHKLSGNSFETDEKVEEAFDNEEEFIYMINLYNKHGLLKHQFLSFLLRTHNLTTEFEILIIEIIKLFHIFSEIQANSEDIQKNIYFVPWLVKDNHPPNDIDINQPLYIDQQSITLVIRYQFFNTIPINITEMCCVEVQKYSVANNYLGKRYAWSDGLEVFLGNAQIVVFRNVTTNSLYLSVRGNPTYVTDLWKPLQDLYDSFEKLLVPWRGVVRSRHSICAHCVLHGIDPAHRWLPSQVFPDKLVESDAHCEKGEGVIPAALVSYLPHGEDVHKRVKAVEEYLQDNAKEPKEHDCEDVHKRVRAVEEYLQDNAKEPKDHDYPNKKRFKAITEVEEELYSHDLLATKANYKLNPQQSDYVLDQILPSICRINLPGSSGTGFVIGSLMELVTGQTHRYVLTCYHIKICDALRDNQHCEARFENRNPGTPPIIVKILRPLFWNQNLDYVLLKLDASPGLDNYLTGKLSLGELVTVSVPIHNDALVLCAHTAELVIDWGARYVSVEEENIKRKLGKLHDINLRRQLSYFGTPIYPLNEKFMFYQCSCQDGTSGAPCLSASERRLFAMHCGALFKESPNKLEYGVILKYVVEDIATRVHNPGLVAGASNMQQGGLDINQLYELFPFVPRNMNTANNQVTTMQLDE